MPLVRIFVEYNFLHFLFQVGNIKFIRARRKKEDKENVVDDFEAFQGQGQSLRQSKKNWCGNQVNTPPPPPLCLCDKPYIIKSLYRWSLWRTVLNF